VVAVLADIANTVSVPDTPPPVWYGSDEPGRCHRPRPSATVLRYRRLAALGLLAVSVVVGWLSLQAALGRIGGGPLVTTGAPGGLQPASSRVWIVRPGDTLWSIASAIDPRGDVRPLVDRLAAELGTTALYPGEAVAIPGG
jgi:hypothetical protein